MVFIHQRHPSLMDIIRPDCRHWDACWMKLAGYTSTSLRGSRNAKQIGIIRCDDAIFDSSEGYPATLSLDIRIIADTNDCLKSNPTNTWRSLQWIFFVRRLKNSIAPASWGSLHPLDLSIEPIHSQCMHTSERDRRYILSLPDTSPSSSDLNCLEGVWVSVL